VEKGWENCGRKKETKEGAEGEKEEEKVVENCGRKKKHKETREISWRWKHKGERRQMIQREWKKDRNIIQERPVEEWQHQQREKDIR